MNAAKQAATRWVARDPDPVSRKSVQGLLANHEDPKNAEQLLETFQAERLSFGTAGLRGLMGIGNGKMNASWPKRLVIRETTAGLAKYLLESNSHAKEQGVVIAYDGRHGSKIFSEDATGVLAAQGIKVSLFDHTAPTPLCPFTVRETGAAAGIVVTASHNPPAYNGYKVYWQGGNQINDPVDGLIASAIDSVASLPQPPACLTMDEAKSAGLLHLLSTSQFESYISTILSSVSQPASSKEERSNFGIAYTPLHGVGAPCAEKLLAKSGFSRVFTVKEQREPDGDFPTVSFPNPEELGAMDLVMALAESEKCQIAVANDPDADRLAACARDRTGRMKQLTGDQLGSVLGDELLRRTSSSSSSQPVVLSTIVSSRILARLAGSCKARHQETLTGFKWLGKVAKTSKEEGENFVFAYEEALGYLCSEKVWDKDGLSALVILCELAAALNAKGQSLWDRLKEIHQNVGLSITLQKTIKLSPGKSGSSIMTSIRKEIPTMKKVGDYELALVDDLIDRPLKPQDPKEIPRNDVLRFYISSKETEGKSKEKIMLGAPRIIVRPSGTEPKVKIYCEALGEIKESENYEEASGRVEKELNGIVDAFYEWMSKA